MNAPTPLSSATINLNIPKEFTTASLSTYMGKTCFGIVFDVSKFSIEEAAKNSLLGFIGGIIWAIMQILLEVFASNNPPPKELTERTMKYIGEKALKEGAKGALIGGVSSGCKAAFYASKKEYKFYIDPSKSDKLCREIEQTKEIIEAFLNYRSFISEEAAYEVMGPISQEAIVYPLKTPCNHYFNASQILQWIESNGRKSCPTCRAEIRSIHDLEFSWEITIKITKISRAIIERVNNPTLNSIPPDIRNIGIENLRNRLQPLDEHSKVVFDMIDYHVKEALRYSRNDNIISYDDYDNCISALRNWKTLGL